MKNYQKLVVILFGLCRCSVAYGSETLQQNDDQAYLNLLHHDRLVALVKGYERDPHIESKRRIQAEKQASVEAILVRRINREQVSQINDLDKRNQELSSALDASIDANKAYISNIKYLGIASAAVATAYGIYKYFDYRSDLQLQEDIKLIINGYPELCQYYNLGYQQAFVVLFNICMHETHNKISAAKMTLLLETVLKQ